MTLLNYTDFVPTPAPLTSGTTVQSYTDPLGDIWVAKNGVNSGAWKRARDVLHAQWYRNTSWSTPGTTFTNFTMDTVIADNYGLLVSGTTFTAPIAGQWLINFYAACAASAAGQWLQVALDDASPAHVALGTAHAALAVSLQAMLTFERGMSANGTMTLKVASSTASLTGQLGQSWTKASMSYLGTG